MISVTNNTKKFFEEKNSEIYIYGGGDYGKWVARFMRKCSMNFEGFIDKGKQPGRDCYILGKKVIHPDELKVINKRELRIIIAALTVNEILAELPWYVENKDVLCMVPIYDDLALGKSRYDINKFLGYFRAKLITVEIPTIFSDRCTAGFIYRALEKNMISPTINTSISPEDFLKICKNPKDYFSEDIVLDHWTLVRDGTRAVGKVKDIEILFAHADDGVQAIRRWNKMRKWINWDYLIFVMCDETAAIPCETAEEFCAMKDKHLLIRQNVSYAKKCLPGCMFVNHRHFHDRDRVIEGWFDLVGWINGETVI